MPVPTKSSENTTERAVFPDGVPILTTSEPGKPGISASCDATCCAPSISETPGFVGRITTVGIRVGTRVALTMGVPVGWLVGAMVSVGVSDGDGVRVAVGSGSLIATVSALVDQSPVNEP